MGALKKRQRDGLDPLQVEVIRAYAEGLSLPEAAERAGIPVGAIFAWAQADVYLSPPSYRRRPARGASPGRHACGRRRTADPL